MYSKPVSLKCCQQLVQSENKIQTMNGGI